VLKLLKCIKIYGYMSQNMVNVNVEKEKIKI